jgi:Asp-tRNA(Asn)/Glu-tRNA(Gln) amidotransferase A subunit family amidase
MERSFQAAEELVAALRAGAVTSVELTDEAIARIERDDEVINAIWWVFATLYRVLKWALSGFRLSTAMLQAVAARAERRLLQTENYARRALTASWPGFQDGHSPHRTWAAPR